jgi:hypothetical protein
MVNQYHCLQIQSDRANLEALYKVKKKHIFILII